MVELRDRIERATGRSIDRITPLSGGSVGQVYLLRALDNEKLVAKVDAGPAPCLDVEGFMLFFLRRRSSLPVPEPVYVSPELLIMTFLPGESTFSPAAQRHAAELLAQLHGHSAPEFGLDRPTLIGGLHQPNPWTESWLEFFAVQRLQYMAQQALDSGRLPLEMARRLNKLADNVHRWLIEPEVPALIHGDVWTTNVLAQDGRVTAFLDPAVYFASPEIELAFITLFSTFSEPFFSRYNDLRPIVPGFFEERKDLYNLYPLLVHVRLFGGGYVQRIETILRRFGY
jgi:fructosamine-3-kinase